MVRVAMPSLDDMLAKCLNGEGKSYNSVHMPDVKTEAEYLNVMFRY